MSIGRRLCRTADGSSRRGKGTWGTCRQAWRIRGQVVWWLNLKLLDIRRMDCSTFNFQFLKIMLVIQVDVCTSSIGRKAVDQGQRIIGCILLFVSTCATWISFILSLISSYPDTKSVFSPHLWLCTNCCVPAKSDTLSLTRDWRTSHPLTVQVDMTVHLWNRQSIHCHPSLGMQWCLCYCLISREPCRAIWMVEENERIPCLNVWYKLHW